MKKAGLAIVIFLVILVIWASGWLNDERVVSAIESFFRVTLNLFDKAAEKIAELIRK